MKRCLSAISDILMKLTNKFSFNTKTLHVTDEIQAVNGCQ